MGHKQSFLHNCTKLLRVVICLGLLVAIAPTSFGLERAPGSATTRSIFFPMVGHYGTPPIQLVGQTGGRVKAAAVTSNYAFMVIGARLVVADITNPVEPQAPINTTRCACLASSARKPKVGWCDSK